MEDAMDIDPPPNMMSAEELNNVATSLRTQLPQLLPALQAHASQRDMDYTKTTPFLGALPDLIRLISTPAPDKQTLQTLSDVFHDLLHDTVIESTHTQRIQAEYSRRIRAAEQKKGGALTAEEKTDLSLSAEEKEDLRVNTASAEVHRPLLPPHLQLVYYQMRKAELQAALAHDGGTHSRGFRWQKKPGKSGHKFSHFDMITADLAPRADAGTQSRDKRTLGGLEELADTSTAADQSQPGPLQKRTRKGGRHTLLPELSTVLDAAKRQNDELWQGLRLLVDLITETQRSNDALMDMIRHILSLAVYPDPEKEERRQIAQFILEQRCTDKQLGSLLCDCGDYDPDGKFRLELRRYIDSVFQDPEQLAAYRADLPGASPQLKDSCLKCKQNDVRDNQRVTTCDIANDQGRACTQCNSSPTGPCRILCTEGANCAALDVSEVPEDCDDCTFVEALGVSPATSFADWPEFQEPDQYQDTNESDTRRFAGHQFNQRVAGATRESESDGLAPEYIVLLRLKLGMNDVNFLSHTSGYLIERYREQILLPYEEAIQNGDKEVEKDHLARAEGGFYDRCVQLFYATGRQNVRTLAVQIAQDIPALSTPADIRRFQLVPRGCLQCKEKGVKCDANSKDACVQCKSSDPTAACHMLCRRCALLDAARVPGECEHHECEKFDAFGAPDSDRPEMQDPRRYQDTDVSDHRRFAGPQFNQQLPGDEWAASDSLAEEYYALLRFDHPSKQLLRVPTKTIYADQQRRAIEPFENASTEAERAKALRMAQKVYNSCVQLYYLTGRDNVRAIADLLSTDLPLATPAPVFQLTLPPAPTGTGDTPVDEAPVDGATGEAQDVPPELKGFDFGKQAPNKMMQDVVNPLLRQYKEEGSVGKATALQKLQRVGQYVEKNHVSKFFPAFKKGFMTMTDQKWSSSGLLNAAAVGVQKGVRAQDRVREAFRGDFSGLVGRKKKDAAAKK